MTSHRSTRSAWSVAVTLLAMALLLVALFAGAVFIWHVAQVGAYARTFIFVSSWVMWSFVLLSLVVVIAAMVLHYRRPSGHCAPVRPPAAIWLVALAWLIMAAVWGAISV